MPALRTDDGPRKLRAVWLGPKGAELPFEWTYVQWLVTLFAVPVSAAAAAALLWLLGAPGWIQIFAGLCGSLGGVYLAVRVMRNVTFDEPLRHKTATARSEFSRRHRTPAQHPIAWLWPSLHLGDLTPGATQVLTPPKEAHDA